MGKDHYNVLKNWIKKESNKARLIKVTTITSTGSENKIDQQNTQSKAFSIYFQTYDERTIKLLFDETLDKETWNQNIEIMMEWVLDHYQNYPSDKLTSLTSHLMREPKFDYFAIMKKDGCGWIFYDHQSLINKIKK